MVEPAGWTIDEFEQAYRSGTTVSEVIDAVIGLLRAAPTGVLIGDPIESQARADAARLDGVDPHSLPLYGVPFVVKDNIDVAGVATTAGCPGFASTPAGDATVVALLRAAGAIPVAKANLDQFATGLVGTRSPYGTPPNTIDPSLVPGGSSSGSAVAVALGLVPFALGTDTAGSGRVPAALNGIVGVKPTLGSASTMGIVPAMRRLDCPSVFARTVGDAAVVADIIRQPDPRDPYSQRQQERAVFRDRPIVGVPKQWPASVGLSDAMRASFESAVERLADLGCEIRPVDIEPLLEVGSLLYGSSLIGERAAIVGEAIANGIAGLDPVVTEVICRGLHYTAVDAYRTEYELAGRRAELAPMWDEIDVLALPTTPDVATLAQVVDDPHGSNEMMGRLTTFVNLLDLMSVVVPHDVVTASASRSPAGLQLIGPAWSDAEVERLATAFESGSLTTRLPACTVVVVGAHLAGLPLNHQLTERGASMVVASRTTDSYRLFALAGTVPPKPGLIRVEPGAGAEIDVEVWSMDFAAFGSFVDQVPSPLCIGTVFLADGTSHNGFLCEPLALDGALEITEFGGWKPYLRSAAASAAAPPSSG